MSENIWADFLEEHLSEDRIRFFAATTAIGGASEIAKEKKRKIRASWSGITDTLRDARMPHSDDTKAPVRPARGKPTIRHRD